MISQRTILTVALIVQVIFLSSFATGWFLLPGDSREYLQAELVGNPPPVSLVLSESKPLRIEPLYDDEGLIDDRDLGSVLRRILPWFPDAELRPNHVEHALRAWGAEATFSDPSVMSGDDMLSFLTDGGRYAASWNSETRPLLQPVDDGVVIRWGSDVSGSVHHDHLLASLAEAGVSLDHRVSIPGRDPSTLRAVLKQAVRDFDPDERETEWSVLAFAAWLPPQNTHWRNGNGRAIDFDLLAKRLMRCHRKQGVCLGTHRVYSLVVLWRLNERFEHSLLSDDVAADVFAFLETTRDLIIAAQHEDGSWPPNWQDGEFAEERREQDEQLYRRVISTGHHLEWLAIAPEELHPPREDIHRAARWAVQNVRETPQSTIRTNYTFYSHVGNALAMWRKTTPAEFWATWEEEHPGEATALPDDSNQDDRG